MTTVDYSEATVQERYGALQTLLKDYKVTFHQLAVERFNTRGSQHIARVHYNVEIKQAHTSLLESFPFFQPEDLKKGWSGGFYHKPLSETGRKERYVSFFNCLALDYGYLESEDIKDALDYMQYHGITDANHARKQYTALRDAENKINNILGWRLINGVINIVEGY